MGGRGCRLWHGAITWRPGGFVFSRVRTRPLPSPPVCPAQDLLLSQSWVPVSFMRARTPWHVKCGQVTLPCTCDFLT